MKRSVLLLLVLGVPLTTAGVRAQTSEEKNGLAFEVASIKPNTSGDARSGTRDLPGGRVTITNLRLRDVIRAAYGTNDLEVIGGPSWLDTERWDIVAAAAPGHPNASWQPMMKSLLAERCRLHAHTEQREQPIFRLVFARSDQQLGPKIHATTCKPDDANCAHTTANTSGIVTGTISAVGTTMAHLAETLSRYAERRVFDATALEDARYDYELEWSQEVSIFTAIQEQLGLKLESTRGRVDVVVIDGIERPTPD
ncbi:MAG TPA: TIGR03435 family protein [Vicinamibacterales bacterium]|nr:TIGR03435 family protein [Vicinamibacterales bacterium]